MYSQMLWCMCALIAVFQVETAYLPKYITPCKAFDPEISKCWTRGIENLRPYLTNGLKELQIPPVDPLYIRKLSVSRKHSDTITYEAVYRDIVVTGLKKFQILSSYIDPNSLLIKLKLGYTKLTLSVRNGTAEGNVLGFPVNGTFKLDFDFANLVLDFVLDGEEYAVNGRKFIDWKEGSIEVTYDSIRFTCSDLYEDQYLMQAFNDALNQNPDILASHVKTIIDNSVGSFIIDIINRLYKTYSSDVLFPKY